MSDAPSSLQEVLAAHADAVRLSINTAIPARVTKYDASKQRVDAQPLVKLRRVAEDGAIVADVLPVVPAVPVLFPGAGRWRFTFPITSDTTGLLIFSQASLDKWLVRGGLVDPEDDRRFDLTDGVFIPGLHDFGHPLKSAPIDRLTIGDDEGVQIHIEPGKIKIGSNSSIELEKAVLGDTLWNYLTSVNPLTGLVAWLASHTHPIPAGASSAPTNPPPSPSDFRSSTVDVKK